ncbi:MAG: beta-ketoacyl-[acyl-carrier-protein] synthase family protein [Acidobacteriota bacterium]|nr:beta-ketoacyl-[acyl-carrier-protein] synthase family protein [Acidobacteriota bacterium]MDQ7088513.1 beta-ketoacyl-[acyl-carrier-protein] synthase family protein [Acidobacteriota bacterium]
MYSRRVVITGMGGVSSIGTGLPAITEALKQGRSGIGHVADWAERGIASRVGGLPEAEPDSPITTRKTAKTSSSCGLMAMRASTEALDQAALPLEEVQGSDLPVLIGSGTGSSIENYRIAATVEKHHSTRRVSPFGVPRVMGSTASANVSVALGVRGESWSVSSACSTGAHALGLAAMMIRWGRYDRILAGAADEIDWSRAGAFDAMRALSRGYNDRPEQASRPFDRDRDGFVISGGAGVLVLESLDSALGRGAPIQAEILGFGANSDGRDMVAPDPAGAAGVMRLALDEAGVAPGDVDYVNAHGTSTPQGDPSEARAMEQVFGDRQPWISSTKSITGHAIGAAGALEAIYSVIMLQEGFIAPSRNVENIDESCAHLNLVTEINTLAPRLALSNSFGFGGTNACLVLRRWEDGCA